MSVNYHAAQSRGVLFENHEKVCEQWRQEFSHYDPARMINTLHLETDWEYLYLRYFQRPYRLCLENGVLDKKIDEKWSDQLYFNEAMAIYHFLHHTKDTPTISGSWVSSQAIDGVVSRRPTTDPLLDPFARKYSGKMDELRIACKQAGGNKLDTGDVGYEFEAFPQVHLRLVFWDAEDDFPAQVQILVDRCVTDFIHYETIGCLIADLLDHLEKVSAAWI